jgi:predicted AAA+ superfamily ATPase
LKISIPRTINLLKLLDKKTHFLFGPRSTGKSTEIQKQLSEHAILINLLRTGLQSRLLSAPGTLEEVIDGMNEKRSKLIVIDEIQKIPALLDEVHRLIEEREFRFLLSGSSARRLKASGVNLLGGRAWIARMHPLTFAELPDFNLDRMLRFGGLPHVVHSSYPEDELDAYVATYIDEEIKMEGLVRKIPSFIEFLKLAALSNSQLLNFSKISNDSGVSSTTIREYYQILEDTLIGTMLLPWKQSRKRKPVATAKFYFFDTGVCHMLAGTQTIDRNSDLFGKSLEHWFYMELCAYKSYRNLKIPLYFWRSQDHYEVDFILNDLVAIEVKATKKISQEDFRGINALKEEALPLQYYIISNDPVDAVKDGVSCLHWRTFMDRLWKDQIISKK